MRWVEKAANIGQKSGTPIGSKDEIKTNRCASPKAFIYFTVTA